MILLQYLLNHQGSPSSQLQTHGLPTLQYVILPSGAFYDKTKMTITHNSTRQHLFIKCMLSICITFYTFFAHAQTSTRNYMYEMDSLITDKVSFTTLLNETKRIEKLFSVKGERTYSIDTTAEWNFVCSYKNGWSEFIGPKKKGSGGIGMYRTLFNDIRIARDSNTIFSWDELKKIFYIQPTQFYKDSSGNVYAGPVTMTKNGEYIIIGRGSTYPNGNQTSWDYRHNFYFKRKKP